LNVHPNLWTPAGVIVAVMTALGGFVVWGWSAAGRFFAWFRHDERLKAIEATMATKEQIEAVRAENAEHRADDAKAFQKITDNFEFMREHVASKDDVNRLEATLTQLLLNGFRHAP
jgi:hypothetical protein